VQPEARGVVLAMMSHAPAGHRLRPPRAEAAVGPAARHARRLRAGAARPPIDATTNSASGQNSRGQFLVLHFTDENLADSLRIMTQQDVSAHYLVSDETPPRIYRLVDEGRRAWHAGDSS
jgi:N-acetylmuramoyl-L-alanine amidase